MTHDKYCYPYHIASHMIALAAFHLDVTFHFESQWPKLMGGGVHRFQSLAESFTSIQPCQITY